MSLRNTSSSYGFVARSLHWAIVLGIIAQYLLAEAEDTERAGTVAMSALDWHVSIGIALLALAVVRVLWRTFDDTPVRSGRRETRNSSISCMKCTRCCSMF